MIRSVTIRKRLKVGLIKLVPSPLHLGSGLDYVCACLNRADGDGMTRAVRQHAMTSSSLSEVPGSTMCLIRGVCV